MIIQGFCKIEVVQDFFHQQQHLKMDGWKMI